MNLDEATAERVRHILGSPVVRARAVTDRGYAPNQRWVVRTGAGHSAFVKVAREPLTASWLRAEHAVYSRLSAAFLPELLGWDDDGAEPLLVLEDLTGATWPPPWTRDSVDAVLDTLDEVHATPLDLPKIDTDHQAADGWPVVAEDPGPFLSLGLCSPAWLDRALPVLLEAATPEALTGTATLHLDVRSDNLCLRGGAAVLFDWNHAALGDPQVDVAFWLPSLHAEGGPRPEDVLDLDPAMPAIATGFYAARAGLPVIPTAPRVRVVQRTQVGTALPWAARVLDLPPPDGDPA
ncbi:phosphotransferase [Actinokineospora sp. PR83]|uniref:phosphotransferase n=1 Tax=Actinokineospora sp. PR83 TaxID=2884908 RepID=UPI001F3BB170|nr:phosphotransferase [Actinokineospora sp. PR83]MCG8918551.1 phosphotransferase [Actinokineospora sp. PR83]